MSTRYNDGSHYENHQRAAELADAAAHAHNVGEEHGKQVHLTDRELSQREQQLANEARHSTPVTTGHGVTAFGHSEIAELAHEMWESRGRPDGEPDEDWFRAVETLRARNQRL